SAVSGEHHSQSEGSHANSGSATAQSESQPNKMNKESATDHEHKSKAGQSAEMKKSGANEEAQPGMKHGQKSANEQKHGQSANEHEQKSGSAETHGRHESKSHHGTAAENSNKNESTNGSSGKSANANGRESTNGKGHEAKQLTPAKQKRVREAVSKEHVKSITHADFSVDVGTVVPSHYHFYSLPEDVVSIFPEYRGYDYIVVNDEIVIIQPESHKIVYTMSENRTAEYNHRSTDCR
ncbi:MAG: DUF1236 domain-containing protein, partial [Bradyrhizobium sp.]